MSFIFDAGVWIALDRNDRAMWRRLKAANIAGRRVDGLSASKRE